MHITFFFTFHHDKLFQASAYLDLSLPQCENSLFEKTWFLLRESDTRDQDLSKKCAHFPWGIIAFWTLQQTG